MAEQHFAPLILSGTYAGSIEEPDWTLLDVASENHDRIFERFVRFDQRFGAKPIVHLSLIGFDIDNSRNARLSLSPENITAEGFSLQIRTWLNTRMWSVEVSWLAIGSA
jgi:hypothetical protein